MVFFEQKKIWKVDPYPPYPFVGHSGVTGLLSYAELHTLEFPEQSKTAMVFSPTSQCVDIPINSHDMKDFAIADLTGTCPNCVEFRSSRPIIVLYRYRSREI